MAMLNEHHHSNSKKWKAIGLWALFAFLLIDAIAVHTPWYLAIPILAIIGYFAYIFSISPEHFRKLFGNSRLARSRRKKHNVKSNAGYRH